MQTFQEMYNRLNDEQRRAVDTIDGPLLVLAGPGTGKTQLLSARVANILRSTDTLPQNIVCLTFTDAAALNMRERLSSMIGEAAYDVTINTYHSFASDIIRANPEYFETVDLETGQDTRLERPINELNQLEIIKNIIESLPYSDPLRSAKHYLKSVVSTIADIKQANLSPEDLRAIATENMKTCQQLSRPIQDLYSALGKIPSKVDQAVALFSDILMVIEEAEGTLAQQAVEELAVALEATATEKTKPLTAWKNTWLKRDDSNLWTFTDPYAHEKLLSVASVYERYQKVLSDTGQYDFNDMILSTIKTLITKPDLKFNLQERYQYILLDEFQDTNAAQFELVKILADHPVHEGRPNIMAVGDDDQGIFAFQGANIGNMVQFLSTFRDVTVINLINNYRSHADILHIAHNIAGQIESRLHHSLEGITKDIVAAATSIPATSTIARHEFSSQAAEYGWIADTIAELIRSGTPAHEIAVLAPKHAILESFVPFLNNRGIPVQYEKRENIFETPIVHSILLICEFLFAASRQQLARMDELLPQVLSLEFWALPTEVIWEINWQRYRKTEDTREPWAKLALANPVLKDQVTFLLRLASQADSSSLEHILDYITGAKALDLGTTSYTSPLKSYYFSDISMKSSSLAFFEAISHLSVIRSVLRDQQTREDQQLTVDGLLALKQTYDEAQTPLINTHPIAQAESAVQLQTVYKAKGLEYDYVFLPCMHDDVWGSSAGGASNKLSLPRNLQHIRHATSGDDTLRRLLFVAVTRARYGLYATSHTYKESGKKTLPVKYMHESEDENGRISTVLPKNHQTVIRTEREAEALQSDVDTMWHSRHSVLTPTLRSLLGEHLKHYVMSPTHLNTFTNIEYDGPQEFLLNTLLRFPVAPTPDSMYGNALHRTLETYQKDWTSGNGPSVEESLKRFQENLRRGHLAEQDYQIYLDRGNRALRTYLTRCGERLKQPAGVEVDFRREGVVLDGAVLTGKIDRLEIDKANKTVRIIDFKSGAPSSKWGSTTKYLNYKQQLYFYILLVEKSSTYKGYTVQSAALEFIEPLHNGECAPPLELLYNQDEYTEFKRLIVSVWRHIHTLDLPDISKYPATVTGMRSFIKDLIA